MVPYPRSWFDAWVACAYRPGGFWTTHQPAEHFRTAAATGGALASLLGGLLARHPEIEAVIDVGAGGGELLAALTPLRTDLTLTGIDLRPRPAALATTVGWVQDTWDVRCGGWSGGAAAALLAAIRQPTLLVADEWLDDLPCPVAGTDEGGEWRELWVDRSGRTEAGPPLDPAARRWAERWWPAGGRAEIGLTRDSAWAALVAAVRPYGGAALLIDYGHLRHERPAGGSLAGYRAGRQVRPRPDPTVNLTAHVAVDAVRAAGERMGAVTGQLGRQAAVVRELWPVAAVSDRVGGVSNPVTELVDRSHRAALASPVGWGAQWWLWQS